MTKILFCIGNPLKGDDGIAIELGRAVEKKLPSWRVVYGYDTPEDMVFKIRDLKPDIILMADACVGLETSDPEFIELGDENQYLFATHNIPLNILSLLLKEFCPKVLFLALPILAKNAKNINCRLSQKANQTIKKGIEKIIYMDNILKN